MQGYASRRRIGDIEKLPQPRRSSHAYALTEKRTRLERVLYSKRSHRRLCRLSSVWGESHARRDEQSDFGQVKRILVPILGRSVVLRASSVL